jgi:histidinol phosphatase-like PHP family hydrolase
MRLFLTIAIFSFSSLLFAQQESGVPSPATPSAAMHEQVARLQEKEIPLIDYHIHIRGGMTPLKALSWAKKTGIRSGVLENHGKGWPLADNDKLQEFIENVQKYGEELLIGIQVNDRNWFKTIDPALRKKLDYVLADTMIMDGQKLWLEQEYEIANEEEWLERYFKHCMTVVNEPITILANPTYLPDRIKHRYDDFWTEDRMGTFLDAAKKNKVAMEIQSDTKFPNKEFLELAMKKGVKISIGRNNMDDKPNEIKRSLDYLEELGVKAENMLEVKKRTMTQVNVRLRFRRHVELNGTPLPRPFQRAERKVGNVLRRDR